MLNNKGFIDALAFVAEKHPLVFLLGVLMVIDILSGLCVAIIERKLSSKIGSNGMMRKTMKILLIGTAAALEQIQPDVPCVKLACIFFIVNESLSIVENAKRAGVPIPSSISGVIDNARQLSGELRRSDKNNPPPSSTVKPDTKLP